MFIHDLQICLSYKAIASVEDFIHMDHCHGVSQFLKLENYYYLHLMDGQKNMYMTVFRHGIDIFQCYFFTI